MIESVTKWLGKWFGLPTKILRLIAVPALLIALTGAWAQTSDVTFSRLEKVQVFAFGGIGFANVISQGEKEYDAVVSRSSAETQLEKLLATGSPEAKCYALVGLHRLNAGKFKSLSLSLRSSKARVTTMQGCIMSKQPLGALLERIQAGQFPG